jgi:SAM-dependent methyltransferase
MRALLYDAALWWPERRGMRLRRARVLSSASGRVLEVGAGTGLNVPHYGAAVAELTLAEPEPAMAGRLARRLREAGREERVRQAPAESLPFADGSFDTAFTAFGALPFVPDTASVHAEVARVLRPGGRWVFAVTHPVRWAFPDDPGERGLTATRSYFDRRPYVEKDEAGVVLYAEYHRTLGDHVADVVGAGLVVDRLVEPEWPAGHTRTWGGWGPVRGARLPGTAIFVTRRP